MKAKELKEIIGQKDDDNRSISLRDYLASTQSGLPFYSETVNVWQQVQSTENKANIHDPPRIDIPIQISEPHEPTQEIFHCSSKTQLSDPPKNLKQIMEDDADYYTQLEDEYMDS
ncbi:MAG: hypothetical protein EZS28_046461, partial [Streblomastix strix]